MDKRAKILNCELTGRIFYPQKTKLNSIDTSAKVDHLCENRVFFMRFDPQSSFFNRVLKISSVHSHIVYRLPFITLRTSK